MKEMFKDEGEDEDERSSRNRIAVNTAVVPVAPCVAVFPFLFLVAPTAHKGSCGLMPKSVRQPSCCRQ